MADSSKQEMKNEEEVVDVIPLLADRASTSNTTPNEEERTSAGEGAIPRVNEPLPVSTGALVQDSTSTDRDQDNITRPSVPTTSAQIAFRNERRSFLLSQDLSSVFSRNPRRFGELESSSNVTDENMNTYSPLSVIDVAPASTLSAETNEQDELDDMFVETNSPSTSSSTPGNGRFRSLFQDQPQHDLLPVEIIPDGYRSAPMNGLRSSPVPTGAIHRYFQSRSIFTAMRYGPSSPRFYQRPSWNQFQGIQYNRDRSGSGDGNSHGMFPREVVPQLLPLRVRGLRSTRSLTRGHYDVSPSRYLVSSLGQSLASRPYRNVFAHRRHFITSLEASNTMPMRRDPRRVRELHSRAGRRPMRAQHVHFVGRRTPESRRELQNRNEDEEAFPALFPRERGIPGVTRRRRNISPIARNRFGVFARTRGVARRLTFALDAREMNPVVIPPPVPENAGASADNSSGVADASQARDETPHAREDASVATGAVREGSVPPGNMPNRFGTRGKDPKP